MLDPADRCGAHRKHAHADRGKADRLERHPGGFTAIAQFCVRASAAVNHMLDEVQVAEAERIVPASHAFVFPVGGEKELLEVVAADGQEFHRLEEMVRGERQ